MTGFAILMGIIALVLGLAAGIPALADRRRRRLDQAAETAALQRAEAEPRPTPESLADDWRAREWRTSYDALIADINRQFDALVAGLPRSDDEPLPVGYWPDLSDDTLELALPALAEFEPTVALVVIRRENMARPVFSWSTSEFPQVRPSFPTADRRRQRRHARHALVPR